jgi:outer membrane biosynthesis protein TonB
MSYLYSFFVALWLMINHLKKKRPFVFYAVAVTVAHLLSIMMLAFSPNEQPKQQNLQVKTVRLQPTVNHLKKKQASLPASQAATSTDTENKNSKKKEIVNLIQAKKKTPVLTTKPKLNPQEKKIAKNKPSSLPAKQPSHSQKGSASLKPISHLSHLKAAISDLEAIHFDSKLLTLSDSADSYDENNERSFDQTLMLFLHTWLKLPEYGSVTIEIHLNAHGKVIRFQTLESQSDRNRLFIEERIGHLTFPVEEKALSGQAGWSRVLVLSNE